MSLISFQIGSTNQTLASGPPCAHRFTAIGDNTKMSKPFEIKRVPVHDQVRDHLQDMIRGGRFSPGTALPPERELAATLGVSRHSLRQALSSLEAVGMIETRHGSGVFLTERPSDAAVIRVSDMLFEGNRSLTDVVEARLGIEPFIASTAAERRTERDLASLHRAMHAHTADGETEDVFGFHEELVRMTKNPVLSGIMRSLTTGPRGITRLNEHDPETNPWWHLDHERIYAAIESGDGTEASRLMTDHILSILRLARAADTSETDQI